MPPNRITEELNKVAARQNIVFGYVDTVLL
jgi:hypothetical protein